MYSTMTPSGSYEKTSDRFKPRQWDRREVPLMAELVFPTRGIRNIHAAKCTLKDIGEGGAAIWVGHLQNIPDLFYMELDNGRVSISCHVVNKTGGTIHVRFGQTLSSDVLDRVIANHEEGLNSRGRG